MKNKSLRTKYLYRFVLSGALCAAISCTASIPTFADEVIAEDAALVTEADASDAVDVVAEDDEVLRRMMFQPARRHIALHIVVKRPLCARKCEARFQRQRKKPHAMHTAAAIRQAACAL